MIGVSVCSASTKHIVYNIEKHSNNTINTIVQWLMPLKRQVKHVLCLYDQSSVYSADYFRISAAVIARCSRWERKMNRRFARCEESVKISNLSAECGCGIVQKWRGVHSQLFLEAVRLCPSVLAHGLHNCHTIHWLLRRRLYFLSPLCIIFTCYSLPSFF